MSVSPFFFFFNDTATTEIYTLSLHDALPIYLDRMARRAHPGSDTIAVDFLDRRRGDRKSTRLNSSHSQISYAVFCLKKKKIELRCGSRARDSPLTVCLHSRGRSFSRRGRTVC